MDPQAAGLQTGTGAVTAAVRGADGWPVTEAVLTLIDGTGAQAARCQGDAQGSIVAPGLAPGAYTAIVTAVGHEPLARSTVVHDGASTALGEVELRRVGGADLPAPGLWRIDPVHSSIQVTAKHLGISSIHGRFNDFAGEITVANPVETSAVAARIVAASIDTGNDMRDEHLRNADFLNTEQHPEIAFRSTGLTRRGGDRWDLSGELTLCGMTRQVVLDTQFAGVGPDPWGGTRASATATAQLSRDDFAMTFNQALQTGIAAVGTTLKVQIDIQAVRED